MNRKKYVKAMLKAIDKACEPVWIGQSKGSRTDGLRVIKRFEHVNNIKFDPFNDLHIELIYGHADNESFFRRLKLLKLGE